MRRTLRALGDDRGTVTAEFAIVLPAALLVLGLVIGGVLLASHRIALTSAAADLARLEARGDEAGAEERRSELPDGVSVSRRTSGGLLCVRLSSAPGDGLLSRVGIGAEACAARSGSGG